MSAYSPLRIVPLDMLPGDRWNDSALPRQMGTRVLHKPKVHGSRPDRVYVVFSNHQAYYLAPDVARLVERPTPASAEGGESRG